MHKFKLTNGLTVVYDKVNTDSVTVQICVKTGSNKEDEKLLGISHFIEHLLFEGTKKRPNSKIITQQIEKYGGDFNAYTCEERTSYFIKILNTHFVNALDVLSDIIKNPLFSNKCIVQERHIISEEIKMISDEPRQYQWQLFKRTLFSLHPSKNPVAGTQETITRIKRQHIVDYYKKNYVANNMVLVIVGDVGSLSSVKGRVNRYFDDVRKGYLSNSTASSEKPLSMIKTKSERRKIKSAYLVIGYLTQLRNTYDAYVLDVIKAILACGQSSRLFQEIRVKAKLGYDVGVLHEAELSHGFFAIYLVTSKYKLNKGKSLLLKELKKLNKISKEELANAKNFIEGKLKIQNEDTQLKADSLSFWEHISKAEDSYSYFSKIRKVTLKDINKVIKKYFTKNHVEVIISS